jgi:hypothetical protein
MYFMNMRIVATSLVLAAVTVAFAACSTSAAETGDPVVRSHFQGTITVNPEIDPTPNFSGFQILVFEERLNGIDTLGIAETDQGGFFQMDIEAPGRGIFPLVISRAGQIVHIDQIVLAEGDSAQVRAQFPLPGRRVLRIRSAENAALVAYENARAQYSNQMLEMLQGGYDAENAARITAQASNLLWTLQETFPGTLGAELAASESITMIEDWNDELVLERATTIAPASAGFLEVARAARRAETRRAGQQAGIQVLETFIDRAAGASIDLRAALDAERVIAYMDSLQRDEALDAARYIGSSYPGTPWVEWAERARYELDNLMPGMPAPELIATTQDGDSFDIATLKGKYVVLEFFAPGDQQYERQLTMRKALADALQNRAAFVSVMLEPNQLRREAFLEGRNISGIHIPAAGLNDPIVRRYNVHVLPTRVVIDNEGKIVGKFIGESFNLMQEHLLSLL